MALKLGVDVGGTFTDVLLLAEESGELTIAGIAQACASRGVAPRRRRAHPHARPS